MSERCCDSPGSSSLTLPLLLESKRSSDASIRTCGSPGCELQEWGLWECPRSSLWIVVNKWVETEGHCFPVGRPYLSSTCQGHGGLCGSFFPAARVGVDLHGPWADAISHCSCNQQALRFSQLSIWVQKHLFLSLISPLSRLSNMEDKGLQAPWFSCFPDKSSTFMPSLKVWNSPSSTPP